MVTIQDVWDMVAKALNYETTQQKMQVRTPCWLAYCSLAERGPFLNLRQYKSISFSGASATLPSNAIGAYDIVGTSDVYSFCEQADASQAADHPRWFYAAQAESASPSATKSVNIVSAAGGAAATDTCTVYYWVYPKQPAQGSEQLLLPDSRALVLKTVIDVLGLFDKKEEQADRYRIELESAVNELIAKIPTAPHSGANRSRSGQALPRGGRN